MWAERAPAGRSAANLRGRRLTGTTTIANLDNKYTGLQVQRITSAVRERISASLNRFSFGVNAIFQRQWILESSSAK
jgi:hypothetical protein